MANRCFASFSLTSSLYHHSPYLYDLNNLVDCCSAVILRNFEKDVPESDNIGTEGHFLGKKEIHNPDLSEGLIEHIRVQPHDFLRVDVRWVLYQQRLSAYLDGIVLVFMCTTTPKLPLLRILTWTRFSKNGSPKRTALMMAISSSDTCAFSNRLIWIHARMLMRVNMANSKARCLFIFILYDIRHGN